MAQKLVMSVDAAFGLVCDVERTTDRKSGFRPARLDSRAGKEMFGELRLDGFAALLRLGFAKRLVMVGDIESRYKDETPVINRAVVINKMLMCDLGIAPERLSALFTNSQTSGSIAAIAKQVKQTPRDWGNYAVVSNFYHLPRVFFDLKAANLSIPVYPAEAFWLLEDERRKNELIERLKGGPLAERIAEELQGIAHKLSGTYKSGVGA